MKKIVILIGLFSTLNQHAQFQARLIEGDYTPVAATRFEIETQNKKYKDTPHTGFDSERKLWHAIWTQFDAYKSKQKKDVSVIYYSRSDEGKTWTTPKQLNSISGDCLDGDSTLKGPMTCIGINGEVYATWASHKGLAFQCSLDSGKTWLNTEKIINPIQGGWLNQVDGIKTNGLPFIACDKSKGEFSGRIYITWSDEKNGAKNKDVFLVYSDDKGQSWTESVLVTYHPNHKEQFKPCMLVDTMKGSVYILYFDKQNFYQGKETDLYLAQSTNGGLKFDYFKMNEAPFLFNSNFIELTAGYDGVKPRWVQADGIRRFGFYEVTINDSTLNEYNNKYLAEEIGMSRSFKFEDKITLEVNMKRNALLKAAVTKPLEPGFEKLVLNDKPVFEGDNTLVIDMKKAGLKKGNYVLTLYYNNRNTFVWITDE